ncbi:MAG: ABC transporter substrate-binding protein [Chloroflexi bacterium]|nr:ABC transporter substrate-binding protein [Chloroflexota bacterium]
MKRNAIWLIVACLLALSLALSSCAQAPATTKPSTPTTAPTQAAPTTAATTAPKSPAAPVAEKPKYGGTLKIGWASDIIYFDEVAGRPDQVITMQVTNEELWRGDWAKGPAGGYGSRETDWDGLFDIWELNTGYVAESWEIPTKIEGDKAAVIWHIRKGARWALNPDSEASKLVGGREMTADDVAFSLKQATSDTRAYIYKTHADLRNMPITVVDKYTVKMEFPWTSFSTAIGRLADFMEVVPPEVVKKYGTMADWKVSVGTGAFMLTEVTPGTSLTLVRNPNYWMKNPVGPGKGDQLPYLDSFKYLIIPDVSTRYAALRTAKVDWVNTVSYDDATQLKKTNPQLVLHEYPIITAGSALGMRTDRKPFDDKRVRRAMMLAIDYEGIKSKLYSGKGQILTWPIKYYNELAGAYLGLDDPEMPASVKELYSYNPEKAKALLKEAGYPNGFKTWINYAATSGATTDTTDYFSILADMWGKIGIQVELRPMETAAFETMTRTKAHEQMATGIGAWPSSQLFAMGNYRGLTSRDNVSMVDDPVVDQAYFEMQKLFVTDRAGAYRRYKELMKYVLDQAWAIPAVNAPQYTIWWPWIKNYSGEFSPGYNNRIWMNWVWLDQDLKKSMGY